jgi:hypothetical protein
MRKQMAVDGVALNKTHVIKVVVILYKKDYHAVGTHHFFR